VNTRSLRFCLIMWYAGLLSAVFILFSVATCQLLRHYLEHSLADSLLRRADQIALSLLADADKTGEHYVIDEIKARYVFEMIYDPPETKLMKLARASGAEVIPGYEMFVHQAARQFEIWTGKPAPWDEMLRVVTKVLEERAAAKNSGNEARKK